MAVGVDAERSDKKKAFLGGKCTGTIIIPIFYNSPTCFSFQRHFTVFAFNFPSLDALNTIYSQILSFHFRQQAFGPSVLRSGPTLIQAAIAVHAMMAHHFLPTAVRFHYLFNMRDLSSIFQVPGWLSVMHLRWRNDSSNVHGVQL